MTAQTRNPAKTAPAPKTAAVATPAAEAERGQRKSLEGVVVSDKMDKTRVVRVVRSVRHPFYEKVIKKSKKFHAHDEGNTAKAGDVVEMVSTRPLSKTKRWRIVRVVKAAPKGAEVK